MIKTENKKEFELILAIVNAGFSGIVVDAARNAGAGGATLIKGRGTGVHETESFLGVQIQPEKDIIMILTAKDERTKIMQAICKEAGLDTEGHGLCFSIPVEDWSGICHLTNQNNENAIQETSESKEAKNDDDKKDNSNTKKEDIPESKNKK